MCFRYVLLLLISFPALGACASATAASSSPKPVLECPDLSGEKYQDLLSQTRIDRFIDQHHVCAATELWNRGHIDGTSYFHGLTDRIDKTRHRLQLMTKESAVPDYPGDQLTAYVLEHIGNTKLHKHRSGKIYKQLGDIFSTKNSNLYNHRKASEYYERAYFIAFDKNPHPSECSLYFDNILQNSPNDIEESIIHSIKKLCHLSVERLLSIAYSYEHGRSDYKQDLFIAHKIYSHLHARTSLAPEIDPNLKDKISDKSYSLYN